MALSGVLTLTDLNDFITPAQACIKPVEQVEQEEQEAGAAATEIQVDINGQYYEANVQGPAGRSSKKLKPAQISLNDCLACSGCITSAETVLITLQSHTEVLSVLDSNPPPSSPSHKIPILSVSPQSIASISAKLSATSVTPVSVSQAFQRIRSFAMQTLGFEYVFDTTFARHLALQEHIREFRERCDSKPQTEDGDLQMPMLASACPGWICYAEKTHSEILPFISRTKSPQQIMGTLVKEWLAPQLDKGPADVYHVTVMPCYDKKLEASRQDFYNEIYSTRDVDCVITTGELELLMTEKYSNPAVPTSRETELAAVFPEFLVHPGSSSGSYLQALVDEISSQAGPSSLTLETRVVRSDYEDIILKRIDTGEIVFKGGKCYGFRNLQNMVRRIGKDTGVNTGRGAAGRAPRITKRVGTKNSGNDKRNYDYVEIMACPSGCVNGGGQLSRPPELQSSSGPSPDGQQSNRWGDKEWVAKVEDAYWNGTPKPESETADRSRERADLLAQEIRAYLKGKARSGSENDPFRTSYHRVQSEVIGLAVKW